MRVAAVNADPGIAPDRAKGAAVHLAEVRAALRDRVPGWMLWAAERAVLRFAER